MLGLPGNLSGNAVNQALYVLLLVGIPAIFSRLVHAATEHASAVPRRHPQAGIT